MDKHSLALHKDKLVLQEQQMSKKKANVKQRENSKKSRELRIANEIQRNKDLKAMLHQRATTMEYQWRYMQLIEQTKKQQQSQDITPELKERFASQMNGMQDIIKQLAVKNEEQGSIIDSLQRSESVNSKKLDFANTEMLALRTKYQEATSDLLSAKEELKTIQEKLKTPANRFSRTEFSKTTKIVVVDTNFLVNMGIFFK